MPYSNVPNWKRAVIKIGSSIIAPDGKGVSTKYILNIASFIIESRNKGKEVILVSSGAVAAGLATQHQLHQRIFRTIPEKQALAAIGQTLMMQNWSRLFDFPCAQLLLTRDGINNRKRFVNAKNTLMELLNLNTLPIVNENDTIAIDELKLGDNDNLAAYVALLADADLLIICSDIDGLYDANPSENPNAKLIPLVKEIDSKILAFAGKTNNPIATGGMITKIEAAEKAVSRGINTIILNGKKRESFDSLIQGKVKGTLFMGMDCPVNAKKHWMLHALKTTGRIFVDKGAANAIEIKGASLLPSGIIDTEGKFTNGDAVDIIYKDGTIEHNIAKGISQYNSKDIKKIMGMKSSEIEAALGYFIADYVIHREDLVLRKEN